ncbi:Trk system potassium transporter TrkA [Legionella gresilensis]|uniref:Trk system potassium transporter TrkA n=1 Tax=Legionella gresilensis TaxID=91823 RepID=UPI001041B245|nr:Trk system potassium transporter TrkA [Legionella gresilensis]
MRIVILGAGQVGGTLARNLAREENDITLIDLDESKLRDLGHRLDIQTVHGSGSHPSVLIEAGIEQADMLIAVTNSDEINMMGCQIAYSLFRTPMKIARIRSQHYYNYPELFHKDHVPVDVCISPEKLITEHIQNLIDYPGATQVFEFGDGLLLMVTIKLAADSTMVDQKLSALHQKLTQIDFRIITIFRNNTAIAPNRDTKLQVDDLILFIAPPQAIQHIMIVLGCYAPPNRRIIIAGGGHIGSQLAQTLESSYRIKVIDHNSNRTMDLASQLNRGTVLQGDIADCDLLINENIEFTDVFCAVTDDDEANIMSCLQAKRLGVRQAMALVNRHAYVELIKDSAIDQAISPQLITIGCILAKLRGGHMVKVHRLQNGEAEAIELITHGDHYTSHVVGRRLDEIEIPPSCIIAAIIRDNKPLLASPELIIESDDHVILLLLKRRYIRQLETLFQVTLTFMN